MTFADAWIRIGPAIVCWISLIVLVVGVFGLGFKVRTLGTILAIVTLALPTLVFVALVSVWGSTPHGLDGMTVLAALFESLIVTFGFLCAAIPIALLRHWRLNRFSPKSWLF